MEKVKEVFTPEQLAAAAAILQTLIRELDSEVGGIEEACGECGSTTGWDEAVYDLLARKWLCPKCWEDAMEDVLPTSEAEFPTGTETEG